jgi:hypothetical protein
MSTTLIDDVIVRLSRPLNVADREAFRAAAEDALSRVSCQGDASIYRCVASLQRSFRDPPSDARALWDIGMEIGPSKLRDQPPIEHGGHRRRVRNATRR